MISQAVIEKLTSEKPVGFTERGGTMRMYCVVTKCSQQDWLETLAYVEAEGMIEKTGAYHHATGGTEYSWKGQ